MRKTFCDICATEITSENVPGKVDMKYDDHPAQVKICVQFKFQEEGKSDICCNCLFDLIKFKDTRPMPMIVVPPSAPDEDDIPF